MKRSNMHSADAMAAAASSYPAPKPDPADDSLTSELCDELRTQGVMSRGYGILPKYPMLDDSLTLEAKGIYALFCSYAGSGNTAFPGWQRIVGLLGVNKDTYYKHLRLLTEQGYVQVERIKTPGARGFQRNRYTLVSCPEKFRAAAQEAYREKRYAVIRAGGLRSAGYGYIPKAVMLDARLTLQEKAVYAYYCVFTGAGESARPKKEDILRHLGISDRSYRKYNQSLVACNYLVVRQRVVNGRMSVNDFYLVDAPEEVRQGRGEAAPCGKISEVLGDTAVSGGNFSEVRKSEVHVSEVAESEVKKPEANSNSSRNPNPKEKNSFSERKEREADAFFAQREEYLSILAGGTALTQYTSAQKRERRLAAEEMFALGTIPTRWISDRKRMKAALSLLLEDDRFGCKETYRDAPDGEEQFALYRLFRDALTDLLTAVRPLELDGVRVEAEEALEGLLPFVAIREPDTLRIEGLFETVREDYRAATRRRVIRAPLKYMKSCIWTALRHPFLNSSTHLNSFG